MKLDELYFGIKLHPMNYRNRAERSTLKTYNLFDFSRIKESIAIYRTMDEERKKTLTDPLHFCFGDVWSRCEFEFIVCPWPFGDDERVVESGVKVDTYEMYVEPNKDYLMSLVESVDEKDCKKYLSELRKQRRK